MRIRQWVLSAAAAVLVTGCGPTGNGEPAAGGEPDTTAAAPAEASRAPAPAREAAEPTEIVPGLTMRVLEEGSGATAAAGDTAVVHYTGWLYDEAAANHRGAKFDSSVDRGQPFDFTLGAGEVIRGWDEGVRGMRVGEVRELTIAPHLGYGNRGVGPIPPGSTLVFEVELLDIKPGNAAGTS